MNKARLSLLISAMIFPNFALSQQKETSVICIFSSKCGVVDDRGNWILAPIFEEINDFTHHDFTAVKIDGEDGVISITGSWLVTPSFSHIGNFGENGLAYAETTSGQTGYIDQNGDWKFEVDYSFGAEFSSNGLARIKESGKWGFISEGGELSIPAVFESAENFIGDAAVVGIDGNYGLIDSSGRWIAEPRLQSIRYHGQKEGMPFLAQHDGKYGYLDPVSGSWMIEPSFEEAGLFGENGLAPVRIDQRWGYIDRQGFAVIEANFSAAQQFSNGGVAAVSNGNGFGLIDETGSWVKPPIYQRIGSVWDGSLVGAKTAGSEWGLINQAGDWAVEPLGDVEVSRLVTRSENVFTIMTYAHRAVQSDPEQAFLWATAAAIKCSADGQNLLGWMYDTGTGVGVDKAEAVSWYGRAAEQGSRSAQFNLALKYAYGDGVEQSSALAREWFGKARAAGFDDARIQEQLDYLSSLESQPAITGNSGGASCSQNLELGFNISGRSDNDARLSVTASNYAQVYETGSQAFITTTGNDCVGGTYNFSYAVRLDNLGSDDYNTYTGSITARDSDSRCYVDIGENGGYPAVTCN